MAAPPPRRPGRPTPASLRSPTPAWRRRRTPGRREPAGVCARRRCRHHRRATSATATHASETSEASSPESRRELPGDHEGGQKEARCRRRRGRRGIRGAGAPSQRQGGRVRRRAGERPQDQGFRLSVAAADAIHARLRRRQRQGRREQRRVRAEPRLLARRGASLQMALGQAAGRLRRARLLESAAGVEAGVRRDQAEQAPGAHLRPVQADLLAAGAAPYRRVRAGRHRSHRQPDQGHAVRRPRRRRDGAGRSAPQAALAAHLSGRVRRRRRGGRGDSGDHRQRQHRAPTWRRRRCC